MCVQGKELELGESGKDVARFLAVLSPLFSAPLRWCGYFSRIFPTSGAGWRGGGLSLKQVLCQSRFSLVWADWCEIGRHFWREKPAVSWLRARTIDLLWFVLGMGWRLNGGFAFLSFKVRNSACERQASKHHVGISVWFPCYEQESFKFPVVSLPLKVQLT